MITLAKVLSQFEEKYGQGHSMSENRMRTLLAGGRIPGAVKDGHGDWFIPEDYKIMPARLGPQSAYMARIGVVVTGRGVDPINLAFDHMKDVLPYLRRLIEGVPLNGEVNGYTTAHVFERGRSEDRTYFFNTRGWVLDGDEGIQKSQTTTKTRPSARLNEAIKNVSEAIALSVKLGVVTENLEYRELMSLYEAGDMEGLNDRLSNHELRKSISWTARHSNKRFANKLEDECSDFGAMV